MIAASASVRYPVRSGPLEAIHESLNARWRAAGVRWAEHYGDPAGEAQVVRSAAGLLDWGPLNKLVVQGAGTATALAGAALPFVPGAVMPGAVTGVRLQVWGIASDEAVVLSRPDTPLPAITAQQASAVDLSSALTVLRLIGPNARDVLAELCPADVGPDALRDFRVVHAPVSGVRVTVARHDLAAIPAFTILVRREYAAYMWDALVRTGVHYHLAPVGNHVAEGL